MNFRTVVSIPPAQKQICHKNRLLLFGSCFTESIGEKLIHAKFSADINPFGIQYNPLSVEKSIKRLISKELFIENDLFEHENRWHSFMHHSSFSENSIENSLKNINERIIQSSENLQQTDFLFITFGTAWVYELAETGEMVSNCHKLPENQFKRRCLSVEEITNVYQLLINELLSVNKKLNIIFTISPIRHWKDGAHENNVSKSILLLAVDNLQKEFNCVGYFPAYELVMDELRDYRFYAQDMLHPNQTAIDYIWERFENCYFSSETQRTAAEMEKLTKSLQHRPFNTKTEVYTDFCEKQLVKIEHYEKAYPEIDFTAEKNIFRNNIISL